MKKVLFILFLFIIFNTNICAISDTFYLGDKVLNMYIEEYDDYNLHNGAPFVIKSTTGKIVYCLNPFKYVNSETPYTGYTYNDKIFNLTDSQLDKINLISYYGYGYKGHEDLKWYGITQFLIWKTMNFNDIYFTDKHYGDRIVAYEKEVKEVEDLVNDYYKLPSFANETFEFSINSNNTIIDENNILSNYEIVESDLDTYISDNKLILNTKDSGNYKVKFIRKSNMYKDYVLYNLDGAQALIYPGKVNDMSFELNIEVSSGSVTVNKEDSEDLNRLESKLENAKYGLYNNEELITTIITGKDGIGYIDNLPFGKYYIKELEASIGYNLDNNIYEFEINEQNKDIIITSKEEVIKGSIIINKYYGNKNNYNKEDGAEFEIYDVNNNLIDKYTTLNGSIDVKLDYGNYTIKQVKGKKNYKFVNDFNLFINKNENYVFNLYDEEILIVEVPNTFKRDYRYLLPSILVLMGTVLIVIGMKKTTRFE